MVQTGAGFHVFLVEKRYVENADEEEEEIRTEVRKILANQKMQSKMQTYFSTELFKLHSVDKKI